MASYAKLPPLNQSFGSSLVITKMMDEFKNLAIVSLMATETFIFVKVSWFSESENFLTIIYKA